MITEIEILKKQLSASRDKSADLAELLACEKRCHALTAQWVHDAFKKHGVIVSEVADYPAAIDKLLTQQKGQFVFGFVDQTIERLFRANWVGDSVLSSLANMKKQLHKNLNDQLNKYWSGHTAYKIMTKGGFLFDGKANSQKALTPLGEFFMQSMLEGNSSEKPNSSALPCVVCGYRRDEHIDDSSACLEFLMPPNLEAK